MSDAPSRGPADAEPTPAADGAAYPEEVEVLELPGRRVVLVGTAHVSAASVELVRRVIERERPDAVCVELDERRLQALEQKQRWEGLDLREVIRKRQLATLLLNLALSSFQKRIGQKLGVTPGSELLAAVEQARAAGVRVELCDRDVRVTLRRAWGSLSLWSKSKLVSGLLVGAGQAPELSEAELTRLKQKDVLSELMRELGEAFPELKRALIDERDAYLAHKIAEAPGKTIVAVVGAGHLAGMAEALRAERRADLAELERLPSTPLLQSLLSWGFLASVVLGLIYLGMTQGAQAVGDNALFWVLATGVPSAVGGVLSLAHPLTVVSAFLAAPITTLSPLLGAGYVTALVQVYLVPPRVHELQSMGDDIGKPVLWWRSRLLRVFLVFVLTSVGAAAGAWVGGAALVASWLR